MLWNKPNLKISYKIINHWSWYLEIAKYVVVEVKSHERGWTSWGVVVTDLKGLSVVSHTNLPGYNKNILAELRLQNSHGKNNPEVKRERD